MVTINLSKNEAAWVLICKGWMLKKYPLTSEVDKTTTFIDYIKPYFKDLYGWSAEDFNDDFLNCVFNVLFDIFMKVREDKNNNSDLKSIMSAMALQTYINDEPNPTARGILAIKSQISITRVLDENKTPIFDLNQATDMFINNKS